MYAIVESGSITKTFNNPRKLVVNDIRYSTKIYSLWSDAEKKAIGLYEVEYDNTNKKDENWYINTDETLTYDASSDKVVASYGTATARAIDDDGDFKGLKTVKKEIIEEQCNNILSISDWRVIKAKETGSTLNVGWKTWRASVRTKCNSMQDQIDGASDVDALATLFTYTNTGTEENPVYARPLGEFPTKE
tara:strand:+ start:701 stop:1273 length:573 start_codon:yes stop_codon:yes gene_type:complete